MTLPDIKAVLEEAGFERVATYRFFNKASGIQAKVWWTYALNGDRSYVVWINNLNSFAERIVCYDLPSLRKAVGL